MEIRIWKWVIAISINSKMRRRSSKAPGMVSEMTWWEYFKYILAHFCPDDGFLTDIEDDMKAERHRRRAEHRRRLGLDPNI